MIRFGILPVPRFGILNPIPADTAEVPNQPLRVGNIAGLPMGTGNIHRFYYLENWQTALKCLESGIPELLRERPIWYVLVKGIVHTVGISDQFLIY
jgi:hypothetical protein